MGSRAPVLVLKLAGWFLVVGVVPGVIEESVVVSSGSSSLGDVGGADISR